MPLYMHCILYIKPYQNVFAVEQIYIRVRVLGKLKALRHYTYVGIVDDKIAVRNIEVGVSITINTETA